MVTVIRSDPYGATGIETARSALSQALMQRALQKREADQLAALGQTLEGFDANQPFETQLGGILKQLGQRGISSQNAMPLVSALLQSSQKKQALQQKEALSQQEQQLLAKHSAGIPLTQEERSLLSPQSQRALISKETSQSNLQGRLQADRERQQQQDLAINESYQNFVRPRLKEKYPGRDFPEQFPSGAPPSLVAKIFGEADDVYAKEYEKGVAKENQQYLQNLETSYESVLKQDMQLDRLEKLTDENKESSLAQKAGMQFFEEYFGVPKEFWNNPTNEEIDKLSLDMATTISKVYNGRILQSEFDTFLKTLPRLMQTQDGRRAVMRNMRLFNDAIKLRRQEARKLMQGRRAPPIDLQSQINDNLAEKLDVLRERFREGIADAAQMGSGSVTMIRDGKRYDIPRDQIASAESAGFRRA